MTNPRRRHRAVALLGLVSIAAASLGACDSDDGAKDAPKAIDRADVVTALVDTVILPANQSVSALAGVAYEAVGDLCAVPSTETLDAARSAVAAGWGEWRSTDSFDLGPAMKRRSTSVVSYKVDIDKVDATVAATPPTDPETVRNRTSSSLRGYGAAWHLLTADVAAFVAQPQRCAYLEAVMMVVADETEKVNLGWTLGVDDAPPFRNIALGKGDDALTPTDVVDAVVNMQLSQLESTSKLLTAAAEAEPGAPSGLPVGELFQLAAQVRGVRESYGELDALLKPDVIKRISSEIDALETLLADASKVPSETPPDASSAKEVATAVEALRLTITTEVVSALDVTISFSENDGDS